MNVTKRQKEILDFIDAFIKRNGFPPTYEEIGSGVGLKSLSTVHKHITNLERKKKILHTAGTMRSIEILKPESERFRIEGPERLYDSLLNCYWVMERS